MDLTRKTHEMIAKHFKGKEKRLAVDATLGNGHDCEFLLRLNFEQVIAFDVQAKALIASEKRLETAQLNKATLIQDGHQNMQHHITAKVDCFMFNFGYLPYANKSITTLAETSVDALQSALKLLSGDGIITLLCYPGHEQGEIETKAIQRTLNDLDNGFLVTEHLAILTSPKAPILYVIEGR